MKVDKLLTIAELVEKLPSGKLEMEFWDCGTGACAIGHAIKDGILPELKLVELTSTKDLVPILADNPTVKGFHAVAACLGLTKEQAEELFSPHGYQRHRHNLTDLVAFKIKSFVQAEKALL